MYEFNYENRGSKTFLIYELPAGHELDSMSIGMLLNHKIPGIADTVFTQMDNRKFLRFDVSAKISVNHLFAEPVNKRRLFGVLNGILNAIISVEDYMLLPNSLVFDTDYIFTDINATDPQMICIPLMDENESVDIKQFFKNLIYGIQFDQRDNGDYVVQLINYLNNEHGFSLKDFKLLLQRLAQTKQTPENPSKSSQREQKQTPQRIAPVSTETPVIHEEPQGRNRTPEVISEKKLTDAPIVRREVPSNTFAVDIPPEIPKEKRVTLFYLLQHYNKKNAETYQKQKAYDKARQEAIKQQGKVSHSSGKSDKKSKNVAVSKRNRNADQVQFDIPGQQRLPNQNFVAYEPKSQMMPLSSRQASAEVPSESKPRKPQSRSQVMDSNHLDFGDTISMSDMDNDATVDVGAVSSVMSPWLVRLKTGEEIPINKEEFRIGRGSGYADYRIDDNKAVGHSHAIISYHDENYYVIDTNSKNHTFVDGEPITSNEEVRIVNGTNISFADERYVFRLY